MTEHQPGSRRVIRIEGSLAYVPLTRGKEAVIDAEDVQLVEGVLWFASKGGTSFYAKRNISDEAGARKIVSMHRLIIGAGRGHEVDHIDGNGLNNTRANLRLASRSENQRNRPAPATNTSGFKGVSFRKDKGRWVAYVGIGARKQKHFGYFDTPEDAHAAYVTASAEFHGEFGRTE